MRVNRDGMISKGWGKGEVETGPHGDVKGIIDNLQIYIYQEHLPLKSGEQCCCGQQAICKITFRIILLG